MGGEETQWGVGERHREGGRRDTEVVGERHR